MSPENSEPMDTPRIELTSSEVVIFVAYLLLTVAVGFLVGRTAVGIMRQDILHAI